MNFWSIPLVKSDRVSSVLCGFILALVAALVVAVGVGLMFIVFSYIPEAPQ